MINEERVREALASVKDPEIGRSIVELDMVGPIRIEDDRVDVEIILTVGGCPLKATIEEDVRQVLTAAGASQVTVRFGAMNDAQRAALTARLRPGAGKGLADPNSRTRVVVVASGKGGVGKSTVAVNLAAALADRGHQVGILDADIYGFSVPRMLGVDGRPTALDEHTILPVEAQGMKVISMGSFVGEETPVVWRGPLLMRALQQFVEDVVWGELDYLLVDSPPGTGDVAISLYQLLPGSALVLVTTPQETATRVAARVAHMAKQTNQHLIGVVENMAYYRCSHCGEAEDMFGYGGGQQLADSVKAPLLGRLPLGAAIRAGSDTGHVFVRSEPESEAAAVMREVAVQVERSRVWANKKLRILS